MGKHERFCYFPGFLHFYHEFILFENRKKQSRKKCKIIAQATTFMEIKIQKRKSMLHDHSKSEK